MAITIGRSDDIAPEMNSTPLIDVMLVLITMLIITVPIATHAVKIDIAARPGPPPTIVDTVGVDFDGAMTWNGRMVDRATLDALLSADAAKNPQPVISINADRIARYELVATVLADAQRRGIAHIGFAKAGGE
jgi:biopolymer transport protein ExbD